MSDEPEILVTAWMIAPARWTFFVDGSKTRQGAGAEIAIVSPQGRKTTMSLYLG